MTTDSSYTHDKIWISGRGGTGAAPAPPQYIYTYQTTFVDLIFQSKFSVLFDSAEILILHILNPFFDGRRPTIHSDFHNYYGSV